MAQIKLVATDLDGTFLTDGMESHPENRRVVQACKARGIPVCACTGRNWGACKRIVWQNGLSEYCVTNNGASVVDTRTGEIRYRNRFEPESVRRIVEMSLEMDCQTVSISGHDATYLYRDRAEYFFRHLPQEILDLPKGQWMELKWFDTAREMIEAAADDAERINVGLRREADLAPFCRRCEQIRPVEIAASGFGHIEVTAKDGTKAEALSVLADIYNCGPENVMALGDSFNDLHMLLWAGTGVAMGNADEHVKAIADFVTKTNTEAGFAYAVERMIGLEGTKG